MSVQSSARRLRMPTLFRVALFAAAASLAAYIPFKYATQLHAISGLYAWLFPLSSILAAAGIALAIRPRMACDCSAGVRAGAGALAGLWLVTGVMCVPSLVEMTTKSAAGGSFATFHMVAQHVFLSLSIIAFAMRPQAMTRWTGDESRGATTEITDRKLAGARP